MLLPHVYINFPPPSLIGTPFPRAQRCLHSLLFLKQMIGAIYRPYKAEFHKVDLQEFILKGNKEKKKRMNA